MQNQDSGISSKRAISTRRISVRCQQLLVGIGKRKLRENAPSIEFVGLSRALRQSSSAASQLRNQSSPSTRHENMQDGRIRLLLIQQTEGFGLLNSSPSASERKRNLRTLSAKLEWIECCLNGARENCACKLKRALRRSGSGASQLRNQSGRSNKRENMQCTTVGCY